MPTTPSSDPLHGNGPEAAGRPASRREFVKTSARAMGAGALILLIGETRKAEGQEAQTAVGGMAGLPEGYDLTQHSYVIVIDVRKCIGCGACVRACSRENDVPPHYFRTWVERYQISRTGEIRVDSPNGGMDGFKPTVAGQDATKAFFLPKQCCHCTHTPCVQLCPVGASYRTPDGVILVDEQRCIGCGYCVQGCPYGSRFIHPETHVASKCTLCYHRLTRGLETACVEACPVGARMIGDTKTVGDKVAELVATESVRVLQPELLTEPNCYYLGLTGEAR
ncbi:MAG: 4Fe-4S dicluster domain-containing protein [Planctomycetota bacterium]|jgi:Fe-S-cluster-containing dehydrogenase component